MSPTTLHVQMTSCISIISDGAKQSVSTSNSVRAASSSPSSQQQVQSNNQQRKRRPRLVVAIATLSISEQICAGLVSITTGLALGQACWRYLNYRARLRNQPINTSAMKLTGGILYFGTILTLGPLLSKLMLASQRRRLLRLRQEEARRSQLWYHPQWASSITRTTMTTTTTGSRTIDDNKNKTGEMENAKKSEQQEIALYRALPLTIRQQTLLISACTAIAIVTGMAAYFIDRHYIPRNVKPKRSAWEAIKANAFSDIIEFVTGIGMASLSAYAITSIRRLHHRRRWQRQYSNQRHEYTRTKLKQYQQLGTFPRPSLNDWSLAGYASITTNNDSVRASLHQHALNTIQPIYQFISSSDPDFTQWYVTSSSSLHDTSIKEEAQTNPTAPSPSSSSFRSSIPNARSRQQQVRFVTPSRARNNTL
jgi:hypothetical protein